MATKNLAIREEVYRKLSEAKREGESFSDVIERLVERRTDLMSFWGALADSKNIDEMLDTINMIRRRAVIRTR